MLLRRLAGHVKSQNWFAVWLDFLIVVFGIFFGFQITAWNEQRADRALEAEYLQRIHDELKSARVDLESIIREAQGNRLFAEDLTEFFDGRMAESDHQRLVVAINKFGLDPLLGFDTSTFNDLVSTGRLNLISNIEERQAIQRAYAQLQRLEPIRDPYRDEYKFALSGLIPTSIRRQISAACPEYSAYSACSGLDLDDNAVRSIVEQSDTREALMAFHIRDTGLGVIIGLGGEVLGVLDETLAQLER